MKKAIDKQKIGKFESMCEGLSMQDAIKEAHRCLLCEDAPCSKACPAGTDPGKFIRQIRFDNIKGAARTIRNNNPLGRICAYVCPVEELCEKECSAKACEEAINIGGIQRFASEYGQLTGLEKFSKSKKNKGKVAVVGAGPAGIACAVELAKKDYDVTIFEKESFAGGVPKYGIPSFRLPQDAIDYDLKILSELGIEVEYNSHINKKDEIAWLTTNFKAVFIGIGLTKAHGTSVLEGYDNAVSSADFLYNVETNRQNAQLNGKIVAVLGGGSVAMDSASTAVALGAKRVYIIYRRTMHEMPASESEIEVANAMNITFRTLSVIKSVKATGKNIDFIEGVEVEWVDKRSDGKKTALEIEGTCFSVKVDLVIEAIGSKPNMEDLQMASYISLGNNDEILVNNDYATNIPGVFAGGDIVNGGKTVVLAVGEGKRAAASICEYLTIGGIK